MTKVDAEKLELLAQKWELHAVDGLHAAVHEKCASELRELIEKSS